MLHLLGPLAGASKDDLCRRYAAAADVAHLLAYLAGSERPTPPYKSPTCGNIEQLLHMDTCNSSMCMSNRLTTTVQQDVSDQAYGPERI